LDELPWAFVRSNSSAPAWLAGLPALVEEMAERWGLRLEPHFPGIELNYVAPAVRADGTRSVFKLSRHLEDTRSEIAALRIWDGSGAARLLAADEERGALLIERLVPGTMLVEVAERDDDAATSITAELLQRLWQEPPPTSHGLTTVERWCAAFDRNRASLLDGVDGFPIATFARADELRRELLASTSEPCVLHGDMHHYNVLRAERAEWLTIDPKGLLGDRHFDICQFFRNPRPTREALNSRRLDVFCERLGLDRERARGWLYVHSVLDACWSYEEGLDWRPWLHFADASRSW
jgi:streptomycin 6-kinase